MKTRAPGQPTVIRSNDRVVRGTPGDDIIIGGSASQKIFGRGGNDVIIGGGGGDRIFGGDGFDRIRGGAGGDRISGGNGDDRIAGGRGNDRIKGDAGNDRLAGEIGDDHLNGGKDQDHASGGMGIDVLRGGDGDDVQRGDAGPDFIDGGRGNDTVSFSTQSGPGWDPKNPNSGVRVEGSQPSRWRSTYEGVKYPGSAYGGSRAAGGGGVDGLKSNENVVGSAKEDRITGDFDTVDGGPGRDVATGNIKHVVSANEPPGPADDPKGAVVEVHRSPFSGTTITVNGGRGADDLLVRRVAGVVTITSRSGLALRGPGELKGNTVRLDVKGSLDSVQLNGGTGNDRLRVAGLRPSEEVTLSGGDGNDRLFGGRGNDVLNDGAGDDVLRGGGGDDGLTNSAGRDVLRGERGSDLLVSSSIDKGDLLDGGGGMDNVSFAQAGHDFAVRAKIGGTAQRIDPNGKGHGPKARITGTAEDLEGTELDDVLVGDGKDNHLLGRGGADTLLGLAGDDLLEARYRDADTRLDGGRGRDRASIDAEDRRALRSVERARASGPTR